MAPRKADDVETLRKKLASERTMLSRERIANGKMFDLLGKIIDQVKEKGSDALKAVVQGLVEEADAEERAAQAGGVGGPPAAGDDAGARGGQARGDGESGQAAQGA